MKTYTIIPLSSPSDEPKWTILVERDGHTRPTFQSFKTRDEASRMVERFIASSAAA